MRDSELSGRIKILVLIFISLGINYPSIYGDVSNVDDDTMISGVMLLKSIDLKFLFFPHAAYIYYRPVLFLTYILDRFLWDCLPLFMHLENILLHTCNGLLAYYIAKGLRSIFRLDMDTNGEFYIAALFLLHPINTESVSWISGRTDLLMATFVMLAFYVTLKYGMTQDSSGWRRPLAVIISCIFFMAAALSKETGLAFFPIILALTAVSGNPFGFRSRLSRGLFVLPYLFTTILYFVLRHYATKDIMVLTFKPDSAVMAGVRPDIFKQITVFVKCLGFYIKKLFIPTPLNFIIMKIDRWLYTSIGVAVLIIVTLIILRRGYYGLMTFFTMIFLAPAIYIIFKMVTWTPIAERYLYLSSFGFAAMIIPASYNIVRHERLRTAAICALLLIYGIITAQRVILWQDSVAFFKDAVDKSPSSAVARNEYGNALSKKGYYSEAMHQYTVAKGLSSPGYLLPTLNLIEMKKMVTRDLKTARMEYIAQMNNPIINRQQITERIVAILESELLHNTDDSKKDEILGELLKYRLALNKMYKGGTNAYKLGQLYLRRKEDGPARRYLEEAISVAPEEYYLPAAKKMLSTLKD